MYVHILLLLNNDAMKSTQFYFVRKSSVLLAMIAVTILAIFVQGCTLPQGCAVASPTIIRKIKIKNTMKTNLQSQGRFLLSFETPFVTASGPVPTIEIGTIPVTAVMIQLLTELQKLSGNSQLGKLSAVSLIVPNRDADEYVILASSSPVVTLNGSPLPPPSSENISSQVGPEGEESFQLIIADIYGRPVTIHFAHTMSAYVFIDVMAALGKIRTLNRYSTITAALGGSIAIPLVAQDPAIRTSTSSIVRADSLLPRDPSDASLASGDAIKVRTGHAKTSGKTSRLR